MKRWPVSKIGAYALSWPISEEWYWLAQTFAVGGAHRLTVYQHITFTAAPGAHRVTLGIIRPEGQRSASTATPGYMITLHRPPMKGGSSRSINY